LDEVERRQTLSEKAWTLIRRLARDRDRDLWQRHPHALLAHRPCPPVAHSITSVVLFSNAWTSDARGSSGRCAVSFADLTEKSVPATLATSRADRELESHGRVLGSPIRRGPAVFNDFFLFNVMELECCGA